jgi:hypothetical protein
MAHFWLAHSYRDDSGSTVSAPRGHEENKTFKGTVHVSFRGTHWLEWTFDLPQDLLAYERFMSALDKAHEHGRNHKAEQIRSCLNL